MDISERIRAQIERDTLSMLGATAQVEPEPQPPLTIETIRRAMDLMPPKMTFLSSTLFPREQASFLRTQREHWACAHPDFWANALPVLAEQVRKDVAAFGFSEIEITNIDHESGDDGRVRAHKDRERKRYADALAMSILRENARPIYNSPAFKLDFSS